jgi:hypothetical protein
MPPPSGSSVYRRSLSGAAHFALPTYAPYSNSPSANIYIHRPGASGPSGIFRAFRRTISNLGATRIQNGSPGPVRPTMGGILVMANRSTAFQHIEKAKLRSIGLGHTWTDNMHLAVGKIRRASNRGVGLRRPTAPYPVSDIEHLDNNPEPRCPGGPCWPRRADIADHGGRAEASSLSTHWSQTSLSFPTEKCPGNSFPPIQTRQHWEPHVPTGAHAEQSQAHPP